MWFSKYEVWSMRAGSYESLIFTDSNTFTVGKLFLWEKFQIAERLAIVRPDFESFANYGAILHLNRKYDEAEIFYNKALQLQKDDQTTLKNLEKLKRARAKI